MIVAVIIAVVAAAAISVSVSVHVACIELLAFDGHVAVAVHAAVVDDATATLMVHFSSLLRPFKGLLYVF